MAKGLLIVVSAPSGCGKGTILGQVRQDEKYFYSVSATTREPRPGEIDGVHYHFMTDEKFERMIAQGELLEHAGYCQHYYGTPAAPVEENLAAGKHVLLEIEVKGAMQIRQLRPDAVFIFIEPPSLEVLRQRLENRGTETAEVIAERVQKAAEEMQYKDQYDYCIVNDELADAVADFKAVVRAEELKIRQEQA